MDSKARWMLALVCAALGAGCGFVDARPHVDAAEKFARRTLYENDAPSAQESGKGTVVAPATAADRARLEATPDLSTVERLALGASPSLVVAAHKARARATRASDAGGLPPPVLSTWLWQVPLEAPHRIDQAQMLMFSVRQDFPVSGLLDLGEETDALMAESEAAAGEAEARKIIHAVDVAFVGWVFALRRHETHKAHRLVATELSEATRARLASGGGLADVAQADLQLEVANAHIDEDVSRVEEARARLNVLIGRAPDAPLGDPAWTGPEAASDDLAALFAQAESKRPELRVASLEADADRATAHASDLALTVPSFSVALDAFLPIGEQRAGWGVEVGMSLPWFWNGERGGARADEVTARGGRAIVSAVMKAVREEVTASAMRATTAERHLRLLASRVRPAAIRAVDAARAGFIAGQTSLPAWVDATRMVLEIELEETAAEESLAMALFDLDLAVGVHVARRAVSLEVSP